MSFTVLDRLFVYVSRHERESCRLPDTPPLHFYYSGKIAIGSPVEVFSPLKVFGNRVVHVHCTPVCPFVL